MPSGYSAFVGKVRDEVVQVVQSALGLIYGRPSVAFDALDTDPHVASWASVLAFVQKCDELFVDVTPTCRQRLLGIGGMKLTEHGCHQRNTGQVDRPRPVESLVNWSAVWPGFGRPSARNQLMATPFRSS